MRHGTVHLLAAMMLQDGQMWATCLERNNGEQFRPAVKRLLAQYPWVEGFYLVMDNGPSHIAGLTRALLQERRPWVRVCWTPAHASWLNQAELRLRALSARNLERGHWSSRPAMIEHLEASWAEYNARDAHPFTWSWPRSRFREWVAERAGSIPCRTSATAH